MIFNRTDKRIKFCSSNCANIFRSKEYIDKYNQNPKLCKHCNLTIPYEKHYNNFCNQSCAASFRNIKRGSWPRDVKEKFSQKMKFLYKEGKICLPKGTRKGIQNKNITSRSKPFYECHHCHITFKREFYDQKCCSIECRDSIRSKNKCAKIRISYFNKNDNTETSLQSSWELFIAKWLDEKNIIWLRPSKRLHWFDTTNNKWRTYLPDFYLPSFNKFLDVKNPMKMREDADKIKQLIQLFPLIVGNREEIKNTVLKWQTQ